LSIFCTDTAHFLDKKGAKTLNLRRDTIWFICAVRGNKLFETGRVAAETEAEAGEKAIPWQCNLAWGLSTHGTVPDLVSQDEIISLEGSRIGPYIGWILSDGRMLYVLSEESFFNRAWMNNKSPIAAFWNAVA
jgi:hypothetical protein